ncbi:ATP synthase F1 subunit epsilon [Anaerolentibacter hominis]|uniref:ATP synthase F1 subunit epsilon n=1 Tax=Anaerolentibacter hominis TaxID=3079009 RepID=UPI0031B861BC
MAENGSFQLKIISPDRVFFEGETDFVELNTTEGELGILKNHIPLTAILAPGVLRIHNGGDVREAALHRGFMEILPEGVMILAEVCEWPEEIDINRANEAKIRAERHLKSPGYDFTRANAALMRSLIRLRVARDKN